MDIQPVRKGERVNGMPVKGGFARQTIPIDGFIITEAGHTVFLPAEKVREALALLDARQAVAAGGLPRLVG